MPLRAVNKAREFLAFEFEEDEWEELKATYRQHKLLMPCCAASAIPKTSKLGNFYFAHSRKAGCVYPPESAEHLFLKTIIARAASSSGWKTTTEHRGVDSDGNVWIADVFCEDGSRKVALEVQISRQSRDVTLERQYKYKTSGIRAAWFGADTVFESNYIHANKDTPFFRITKPNLSSVPMMTDFGISLELFVEKLLTGKVKCEDDHWEYQIEYVEDVCPVCNSQVKQVVGSSIDVYGERILTISNTPKVLRRVPLLVTNNFLVDHELNKLGEDASGNMSNICLHCGATQENHRVLDRLSRFKETGTVDFLSPTEFTSTWVVK